MKFKNNSITTTQTIQIPLSCTWQTLRDKFRDVGEVKFAEIRGNDVGVVRFFKERDAELAIGKQPFEQTEIESCFH